LVNAPKTDCRPAGKVMAAMSIADRAPSTKKTKRNSLAMQNDQQTMNSNGVVRFPDLRFMHGTRLKIATVKFSLEVEYLKSDGSVCKSLIESNNSNPFIVMTNENQWESSAGNLLKYYAFKDGLFSEISWNRVC